MRRFVTLVNSNRKLCWLNTVLQLFYNDLFIREICKRASMKDLGTDMVLYTWICKTIRSMYEYVRNSVEKNCFGALEYYKTNELGTLLYSQYTAHGEVCRTYINTTEQQDLSEMFILVFDILSRDVATAQKANNIKPHEVKKTCAFVNRFRIELNSSYMCESCNKKIVVSSVEYIARIAVSRKISEHFDTFNDYINFYLASQKDVKIRQYKCEEKKCGKTENTAIMNVSMELPTSLVFVINRKKSRTRDKDYTDTVIKVGTTTRINGTEYSLQGVIVYQGEGDQGHYYYVRYIGDSLYVVYNDSSCRIIKQKNPEHYEGSVYGCVYTRLAQN